jgi:8-oxo-dGTP pyrophosphatase MutT (NUDIX family)
MTKLKSSGAIFLSKKTKRILLLQKSAGKHEGVWGLVGGKVNKDESIWQGFKREVEEEIGFFPDVIKSIPLENYVSQDEDFNFQTYVCIVEDEFIPKLSNEHNGWCWCELTKYPKPIHRGVKNTIDDKVSKAKLETIFAIFDLI